MDVSRLSEDHKVSLADLANDGAIAVIMRLYKLLVETMDRYRKAKATSVVGVRKAAEVVANENPEIQERAESLADEIRTLIFRAIEDEAHELSVLLPDLLSTIGEEVRETRKLVLKGLDIEDDEADSEELTEMLQVANWAKGLILNYTGDQILAMSGASLDELPDNMVKTNKSGKTVLKLPNVPDVDKTDDKNNEKSGAGRPAQTSKFKYELNGQPIKVSGWDRLAVFHCSTYTDRINGSDLKSLIKRQTGKEWSDKGNEQFTVEVPAGQLTATAVKQ